MAGVMAGAAAVLPCEQLCGRSNRRDRLSQTDDFVQIYLISPQWVSGGLQVCTAIKHPSLCLKRKKKRSMTNVQYPCARGWTDGVTFYVLRLAEWTLHSDELQRLFFFFLPPLFFYGAHTCTVNEQSRLLESKLPSGGSCLINPHPLTLALQRGKGVRRRRRRRKRRKGVVMKDSWAVVMLEWSKGFYVNVSERDAITKWAPWINMHERQIHVHRDT